MALVTPQRTAPSALFRLRTDAKVQLSVAGLAILSALSALSTEDGPVLCPIRRCSGGYCPGCGLTRAGGSLLRGDVAVSWQHHPYLLMALPQAAVAAVVWRLGLVTRVSNPGLVARLILAINAAALVAIWVLRMLGGSIPVPFFS